MIRPDPWRKSFLYRGGGGSLKKSPLKLKKKKDFGRYYFVDLEVRNAYLYPI